MTSHYFWLLLHSLSRFLVQVFRTIVTNHEPTPTQRHRVHWKTTLKSYFLLTFSTRFNIFTITLHIPSTKYFLCLPLATLYKQLHLSNIATFLKISWVENTKKINVCLEIQFAHIALPFGKTLLFWETKVSSLNGEAPWTSGERWVLTNKHLRLGSIQYNTIQYNNEKVLLIFQ